MTAYDVAFIALGVIATAAALLAVTTHQVVHSALWLMVTLGAVAGCYLVLGAELVALVQVLVYVGAIVVLVLFALMLTRAPIGPSRDSSTSLAHRALAALVSAGVTALLLAVLLPLAGDAVDRHVTATSVLATDLFSTWVWPFELLSLLLLAALVAALAVFRAESRPRDPAPRAVGESR